MFPVSKKDRLFGALTSGSEERRGILGDSWEVAEAHTLDRQPAGFFFSWLHHQQQKEHGEGGMGREIYKADLAYQSVFQNNGKK